MNAVYGDEYPGIFEFVEALFSESPDGRFSQLDLQNRHQQLMLSEQRLLELFKQPWARQWARFRDALIESGSIAFVDGSDAILPYEEKYYSNDAATRYQYQLVPAFEPLIRELVYEPPGNRSVGRKSATRER